MSPELRELYRFMHMLLDFSAVKRVAQKPNNEAENDAEHSFQLAIVCRFLADRYKLPLDHSKLLKYALVHDLPEVLTTDIYPFGNEQLVAQKKELESRASVILEESFNSAPELWFYLRAYERQEDQESTFVRAVDKLLPTIIISISSHDHSIVTGQITKERMIEKKYAAMQKHEILVNFFEEIINTLEEHAIFYPDCLHGERKIDPSEFGDYGKEQWYN